MGDADIEMGSRSASEVGASSPETSYTRPAVVAPRKGFVESYVHKGNVANFLALVIMCLGIVLVEVAEVSAGEYFLAFGLFGFAGGVTNWLAIKMLFDRVPGLYGSGVIPRRFREIRGKVKETMMGTFFDADYLERYSTQKLGELTASLNIEERIKQLLESPVVDSIIDRKIAELQTRPEGMMLMMMGITADKLKPMVKPFVVGMASDVAPHITSLLDVGSLIKVERLRREIDQLMTSKLEELTADRVKKLMEEVIREHLGWLIVWGTVFGGLIGVVTVAAGYGGGV